MSVRNWLVASVVVNGVLAALVVFLWQGDARTPAESATSARAARALGSTAVVASADAATHEKILVLASLEAQARLRSAAPATEYWTPAHEATIGTSLQRAEAENETIRNALKARYGDSAEDDPLFARLFRPLDGRYPYLSSRSQIALSKLQRARAGVSRPQPESPPNTAPGRVRDPLLDALRQVLSPAELEEYELRESPLARQLRASGVTTGEQEFRAAFQVLNRTDVSQGPGAYLSAQRDLEKLLGKERTLRFSASRDPAFQTVREAAIAQSLQEAQAMRVYEAIKAAQMSSLEAQSTAGGDRALAAQKIRDITMRRDAQIASLVGDAAAREILAAYSNKMMSMSRRTDVGAL